MYELVHRRIKDIAVDDMVSLFVFSLKGNIATDK